MLFELITAGIDARNAIADAAMDVMHAVDCAADSLSYGYNNRLSSSASTNVRYTSCGNNFSYERRSNSFTLGLPTSYDVEVTFRRMDALHRAGDDNAVFECYVSFFERFPAACREFGNYFADVCRYLQNRYNLKWHILRSSRNNAVLGFQVINLNTNSILCQCIDG